MEALIASVYKRVQGVTLEFTLTYLFTYGGCRDAATTSHRA